MKTRQEFKKFTFVFGRGILAGILVFALLDFIDTKVVPFIVFFVEHFFEKAPYLSIVWGGGFLSAMVLTILLSMSLYSFFNGYLLALILPRILPKTSKEVFAKEVFCEVFKSEGQLKPKVYIHSGERELVGFTFASKNSLPFASPAIYLSHRFCDEIEPKDIRIEAQLVLVRIQEEIEIRIYTYVLIFLSVLLSLTPRYPLLGLVVVLLWSLSSIQFLRLSLARHYLHTMKRFGISLSEFVSYLEGQRLFFKRTVGANSLFRYMNTLLSGDFDRQILTLKEMSELKELSFKSQIWKLFPRKFRYLSLGLFLILLSAAVMSYAPRKAFYYVFVGNVHSMKILLDAGYDPSKKIDSLSPSIVEVAWSQSMESNNSEMLSLLLPKLKTVEDGRYPMRSCALHFAVSKGWLDVFELFLKKGLDPSSKCTPAKGMNLLMISTKNKDDLMFRYLMKNYKLDLGALDSEGAPLISYAIKNKNEKIFFELVKTTSQLNAYLRTPQLMKDFGYSTPVIQKYILEQMELNQISRGLSSKKST